MDEQDLQINITAIDEATPALENVAASAENMATTIDQAAGTIADSMTTSLTAAEEAAADAAIATADSWMGAAETVTQSWDESLAALDTAMTDASESAQGAAQSTVMSWQDSLAVLDTMMNGTEEEAAAAFASMGGAAEDAAAKASSSMEGAMSVFRILMLSTISKQAAGGLDNILKTIVDAAAGDPKKLADLKDQMGQLEAQRAKLEEPISGKGKTTSELAADEAAQSARLATVNQKIKELQPQIDQLTRAQQIGGQAAKDYDAATLKLTQDWQTFLATAGAPLLENAAKTAVALDHIVTKLTEFASAHPRVVQAIGLTIAALAGLLTALSVVFAILVPIILVMWLFAIPFSAAAVGIGLAIAAIVVAVVALAATIYVNWDKISKWTAAIWGDIVNFIKKHWADILSILVPGIGYLVKFLFDHWDTIKTDVQAAWNWIANFISGIWGKIVSDAQAAIGKVQSMINSIMAPVNAVTSAVNNIGSKIGNAVGSVLPHFAEGGIVSSPTIGLIGEAGPEAIIPLSAFAGGLSLAGSNAGNGGNIIVQLSGNFYGSDQQMMQKLSTMLGRMINQQIKLRAH